jgi:beta-lactamase superfamily II metal-dependent hydrolase
VIRRLLLTALVAVGITALFTAASAQAPRPLRVHVLDIGQGDAILVRSPEGKTALIDAGPSSRVVQELERLGVDSIDLVVVTHHHTDHFGGMDDVVRKYRPKFYMATKSSHGGTMYRKLLEDVKAVGCRFLTPDPKGIRLLRLGSVELLVLPQPPLNDEEENDNSIGIIVNYGRFSMMLTGDSEEDQRDWWMETCPATISGCTVLKLAHHGSHNGTDARWLEKLEPELAVVSLASGNSFGHPHKQTLDLLKEYGVPLLRTDQKGTITLESDGRTWRVAGESTMAKSGSSRGRSSAVAAGGGGDSFGRARR